MRHKLAVLLFSRRNRKADFLSLKQHDGLYKHSNQAVNTDNQGEKLFTIPRYSKAFPDKKCFYPDTVLCEIKPQNKVDVWLCIYLDSRFGGSRYSIVKQNIPILTLMLIGGGVKFGLAK